MKFILSLLALVVTLNATFAMEAPTKEDKFVAVILLMDNGDEDQQVVATLYTTLMAAEKVARVLEIEMIAEDEVNDDVFVFSLKSEEQKNLTMKMFDEEGYQLAANRILQVQDGNNYNALNVKSLEDGTYKFQLTDAEGREKTTTVTINRQK
ncbi:T9SS C-terminal target domain-containing protein [Aureispira anguillae]|uniref:T9SS C-terminal target domain-containing protein n=1 Tax=Aureispira anguillae TaxID=2864201 RepID=A0A915YL28_9BACT|nr:T9SS C-terminal target domain-containing protein [Aureispira anguillae]BDS15194.1 T9SS C-terminal target domain-containing protein [Aureispira anguillae]